MGFIDPRNCFLNGRLLTCRFTFIPARSQKSMLFCDTFRALFFSEKREIVISFLVVLSLLGTLGWFLWLSPTMDQEQLPQSLLFLWSVFFIFLSSFVRMPSQKGWFSLCLFHPMSFWQAALLSQSLVFLVVPFFLPVWVWSLLLAPIPTLCATLCGIGWLEIVWALHFLLGERKIFEALLMVLLMVAYLVGVFVFSWGMIGIECLLGSILWIKAKHRYLNKTEEIWL